MLANKIHEIGLKYKFPLAFIDQLIKADNVLNFMFEYKNKKINGTRIQHNNLLGVYKGGIRFSNKTSIDQLHDLACNMTIKNSLVNLPFGGAKGCLYIDKTEYSDEEIEDITRKFSSQLAPVIGYNKDVPAPDVGTNSKLIDIMHDEHQQVWKNTDTSAYTGKSLENGGIPFRSESTGFSVSKCLELYAKYKDIDLNGSRVIIQGFGNVGYNCLKFLSEHNIKLLAIGDHTCYLFNRNGLNIKNLLDYGKSKNDLDNYNEEDNMFSKYTNIQTGKHKFFLTECDFVIPCALGNEIQYEEYNNIKAKCIIEGANNPVCSSVDDKFFHKNIDILPDIFCNSGGVILSYFEYMYGLKNCNAYYDKDLTKQSLENILNETFVSMTEIVKKHKCSYREAAYLLSLNNLYCKFKFRL